MSIKIDNVLACLDDLDQIKAVLDEYALPREATPAGGDQERVDWETRRRREPAKVKLGTTAGDFERVATLGAIPRNERTWFHMEVGRPRPILRASFQTGGIAEITYDDKDDRCTEAASLIGDILRRRRRRIKVSLIRRAWQASGAVALGFAIVPVGLIFAGHGLPLAVYLPILVAISALNWAAAAASFRVRFGPSVVGLRRKEIEAREHTLQVTAGLIAVTITMGVISIVGTHC